ncbi:MAG TPA: hypothetical protein VNK82_01750 [Terriglobales bacterium]|nr:hypothetical protein [Terriglobales bacterium]
MFAQTAGQVVVENPEKLSVPLARVQPLYDVSRRLVAEAFKLEPEQMRDLKLTLVLGARADTAYKVLPGQEVHLFLPQWNEAHFAYAVMLFTLDREIPPKRARSLVRKAIQRVNRMTPVTVDRLRVEAYVGGSAEPSRSSGPRPGRPPDDSFYQSPPKPPLMRD